MNFYNENDPGKAEWLRQLIKRDVIAPGIVDERSILEISASELVQFKQCHFFAGIGIWSYALRLAGWPDDAEVWTGSCPCQPFSVAGKGKGTADERHLWPAWFRLIAERRPVVVFGEQVADGNGQTWLDAVQADMESIHYRFGSVALPAAGFGAPHGRHRTFFVADTHRNGMQRTGAEQFKLDAGCATGDLGHTTECQSGPHDRESRQDDGQQKPIGGSGVSIGVALGDANKAGPQGRRLHETNGSGHSGNGFTARSPSAVNSPMDNPTSARCSPEKQGPEGDARNQTRLRGSECGRGPCNGFWSDAEWLPCTDGKARPVEPGTFPLAHGAAARVLRLRGHGDGIVAPVAAEFIKAAKEVIFK